MSRERVGSGLSAANFLRGDLARYEKAALMDAFASNGVIEDVLGVVRDGKEATVWLCRAHPSTGQDLLAAKVYRAQKFRAFSNAGDYRDVPGRETRGARAIRNKTKVGRRMAHHQWVEREWETLCLLGDAGADVPVAHACSDDAIVMEFLGGGRDAAPLLREVRLEPHEVRPIFELLMRNIEIFLACDRVHGDLSAYNVVYAGGSVKVIDFPQAVDARTHPSALSLLVRDARNVCRYFRPYGIATDPDGFAHDLWSRYTLGRL